MEILFNKIEKIVKKKLSSSPRCHDWEHTQRVIHNAELIMEYEKTADKSVVRLGALLHDIARADEIAIKGKQCHAVRGSELADKILENERIDEVLRGKIVNCVKKHRFRSTLMPETIEEKIVYDADKLDSVGAVGIGRAFLFAGRTGAKVHNTEEAALKSESYSEEDTAFREYLVKLRYIPDRMLTDAGREIAKKRVHYMAGFFEKLNREIFTDDE
ncbi:MAG: HD domain-containing protein [Victivallales bacterium]|nr:HD domain-containing protein [Victivallales bacterium]MCF7888624.1 HD domain-containing protein [Victivallales bacterium]